MEPSETGQAEVFYRPVSFSAVLEHAWKSLKGKWLLSIGVLFIAFAIQCGVDLIPLMQLFSGILLFPLTAGLMGFFLRAVRGEQPVLENLFEPFQQYFRYLWASLRITIFVILWLLLLIIPGIIAGYRYSMTLFVMLDNPGCSVKEAMTASSVIMRGHKLQWFFYSLLFGLICFAGTLLTLGIGLFWLIPLAWSFQAAFYEFIRPRSASVEEPAAPAADPVTPAEPAVQPEGEGSGEGSNP